MWFRYYILANFEHLFNSLPENLVQHPNNNISILEENFCVSFFGSLYQFKITVNSRGMASVME